MIARPGFSTAERVTDVVRARRRRRRRGEPGPLDRRLGRTADGAGAGDVDHNPPPGHAGDHPGAPGPGGDETYALPLTHVRETLQLTPSVVRRVRGNDVLVLRDEVLPLLSLRQIVNLPVRDAEGSQVVVLEVADRRAGLVVDQLRGQQEIVVKPIDSARGAASCFSGATILGDGVPGADPRGDQSLVRGVR